MVGAVVNRLRSGVATADLAPLIGRRELPGYLILAIGTIGVVLGFALTSFELTTTGPLVAGASACAMLAAGMITRRYRLGMLSPILEGLGMLGLSSVIAILASLLLTVVPMPLVDHELASADSLLGFDLDTLIAAMRQHPRIVDASHYIYHSLIWEPNAAIFVLVLTRQSERCRTFVLAWLVTLTITVLLWPLLPSLSVYPAHGLEQADIPGLASSGPWDSARNVLDIRNGSLRAIGDSSAFLGIICFPSFHAAGAALVAWAFWRTPWLWLPFAILNFGVAVTSIPIGSHYVVDIIAGIAVAAVGVGLAKLMAAPPPATNNPRSAMTRR